MTIAKKIMLKYGSLLAKVFMHLIDSLSCLDQMDRINGAIEKVTNPIIEEADRLVETCLVTILYTRRLAILKDSDRFLLLQFKDKDFTILSQK
ncbi:MAG: hypothetical protein ACLPN1_09715 [Dissulfurispiraceae bacterium]